jgi:hypothetical protein
MIIETFFFFFLRNKRKRNADYNRAWLNIIQNYFFLLLVVWCLFAVASLSSCDRWCIFISLHKSHRAIYKCEKMKITILPFWCGIYMYTAIIMSMLITYSDIINWSVNVDNQRLHSYISFACRYSMLWILFRHLKFPNVVCANVP